MLGPGGGAMLGREQAALFGQDHPGKTPPVGDVAAIVVVGEVVAVLQRELVGGFLRQVVQEGMVFDRQGVIVEVVAGVSPDRTADGVELAIDVVVVAPQVQPSSSRQYSLRRTTAVKSRAISDILPTNPQLRAEYYT